MIKLVNAHDMLTVNYALMQLKGYMDPNCGCDQLIVCPVSPQDADPVRWSMCYGQFKVFVFLCPGVNRIELRCAHFEAELRLIYQNALSMLDTELRVRPVYVVCADGPEHFQAPRDVHPTEIDTSARAASKRIALGMQLLQSLTAESLLAEMGTRHTFLLDLGADQPGESCLVYRSRMSSLEVYTSEPRQVWNKLARELYAAYPDRFDQYKWVAFMACTRYNAAAVKPASSGDIPFETILDATRGHFALGTGGLALLGTGTLHAWPEDLSGLEASLLDTRRLDSCGVMDDTAYRHTFWAAFATGLGSVWHELGHCFGLDHSLEGIMDRGGDDIHLCISFPPRGSFCPEGCVRDEKKVWRSGNPKQKAIPPQFRPPPELGAGVQFKSYKCLQQITPAEQQSNPSILEMSFGRFAYCCSLWHQGLAFWGFDQAVKLTRNPWIFRCS